MEPQGRTIASPFHTRRRGKTFHPSKTTLRIRVHVQAVGLNAKTKNRSALSRRGKFSLDIPFYRTSAVEVVGRHCCPHRLRKPRHTAPKQSRRARPCS